jgi:hypothetical protein
LLALTGLAVPVCSKAAQGVAVFCSAEVVYTHRDNAGTLLGQETYQKDFLVVEGVAFVDDFSTATRLKTFTAGVVKEGGTAVVSIDYFNDVGVFHSVGFNTTMTMNTKLESTSGGNAFYTSNLVQPGAVAGNHKTNYTLTCRRN